MKTNSPQFMHPGFGSVRALDLKLEEAVHSIAKKQAKTPIRGRLVGLMALESNQVIGTAFTPLLGIETIKAPAHIVAGPFTKKFSVFQAGVCLFAIPRCVVSSVINTLSLPLRMTLVFGRVMINPRNAIEAEENRLAREKRKTAELQNTTFRKDINEIKQALAELKRAGKEFKTAQKNSFNDIRKELKSNLHNLKMSISELRKELRGEGSSYTWESYRPKDGPEMIWENGVRIK